MKILNLTEGSFPINLSYKLESIDVPKIGSLIGNLEVKLRILRISNNLLKCDGSIKGDFTDICQNCLQETILNIFSEIDVTLKDLNEIHSDSSEQDQTHYQDLEYFNLQKFIEEETGLNYPDIVKCEESCIEENESLKQEKNFPFKKIRDLID